MPIADCIDHPATTQHFVYLVRCSDGSLYAGYTTDPARRVRQHNSGRASRYTRSRLPVILVYHEACGTKSDALRREHAIRTLSKGEKETLVEGL